jgi:hypothetical protein
MYPTASSAYPVDLLILILISFLMGQLLRKNLYVS